MDSEARRKVRQLAANELELLCKPARNDQPCSYSTNYCVCNWQPTKNVVGAKIEQQQQRKHVSFQQTLKTRNTLRHAATSIQKPCKRATELTDSNASGVGLAERSAALEALSQ